MAFFALVVHVSLVFRRRLSQNICKKMSEVATKICGWPFKINRRKRHEENTKHKMQKCKTGENEGYLFLFLQSFLFFVLEKCVDYGAE